MDDKELLIEALEQIPALVKAAETFKETTSHIISTLSSAIKKRPTAEISEAELDKLRNIIMHTQCVKPDIQAISKELSLRLSGEIASIIRSTVKEAADKALRNASVSVEHSHYIEKDLRDIVNAKVKIMILILYTIIVILVSSIGISVISYYNSEDYWGKQYYKITTSKYLTIEEKKKLKEDSYILSVLPGSYFDDASMAQLKIKQIKKILKKRESAAKKKR